MKLTDKARAVLEAAERAQAIDRAIGARQIALILGFGNKYMRAGQYAGKLQAQGWLISEMQWYRGARGHDVYSHTEYFITRKGREELQKRRHRNANHKLRKSPRKRPKRQREPRARDH
jgi:hypothetical protein